MAGIKNQAWGLFNMMPVMKQPQSIGGGVGGPSAPAPQVQAQPMAAQGQAAIQLQPGGYVGLASPAPTEMQPQAMPEFQRVVPSEH